MDILNKRTLLILSIILISHCSSSGDTTQEDNNSPVAGSDGTDSTTQKDLDKVNEESSNSETTNKAGNFKTFDFTEIVQFVVDK
jgi:hypothetical protein|tara:strand:- start:49 stop:300 length:252 start_codon:yes stop_codon:yes gene_type:complete